ncbi:hypothetical protein DFH05DRAFT_1457471 [Lentinula detonsa]|uniref:Uncharacterized protein n=1 Tax=Lentinula detonsa TaxID=2804962 RepID=A0A9W8P4Y0_9AGAR|nr:hypothetical protein DFH05DRAFT_1457471 [Lentinula detonsa]
MNLIMNTVCFHLLILTSCVVWAIPMPEIERIESSRTIQVKWEKPLSYTSIDNHNTQDLIRYGLLYAFEKEPLFFVSPQARIEFLDQPSQKAPDAHADTSTLIIEFQFTTIAPGCKPCKGEVGVSKNDIGESTMVLKDVDGKQLIEIGPVTHSLLMKKHTLGTRSRSTTHWGCLTRMGVLDAFFILEVVVLKLKQFGVSVSRYLVPTNDNLDPSRGRPETLATG